MNRYQVASFKLKVKCLYGIKNKVILITGAGKGNGRLLAEAFAKQGAIVAANDISPINVEDVVASVNANGGKAKAYIEDVAKKVGAQALIKNVEDDFGTIDVLINHATVEPRVSLLKMDEWDWHRVLDVNLTGAFLMVQSIGRMMKEKGSGVIISLVAETSETSEKEAGAYFTSQAGLRELSNQADQELSLHGVKVFVVENSENAIENIFALLEDV
ncbi:MAG: SDR family NAD(P)-dependent oxidoreductase [Anaerolineales bacterium]|nr:SDR family NAD(P)-dependent oxidoreductase [Anaerolineales bacterium]